MERPKPAPDPASPARDDIERRAYERFVQRGGVHGADIEDWLEAERALQPLATAEGINTGPGISNRESATAEDAERQRWPPIEAASSPQEEASEQDAQEVRSGQSSTKTGSRSGAQKRARSRNAERAAPSATKVEGAFGKEPGDLPSA